MFFSSLARQIRSMVGNFSRFTFAFKIFEHKFASCNIFRIDPNFDCFVTCDAITSEIIEIMNIIEIILFIFII